MDSFTKTQDPRHAQLQITINDNQDRRKNDEFHIYILSVWSCNNRKSQPRYRYYEPVMPYSSARRHIYTHSRRSWFIAIQKRTNVSSLLLRTVVTTNLVDDSRVMTTWRSLDIEDSGSRVVRVFVEESTVRLLCSSRVSWSGQSLPRCCIDERQRKLLRQPPIQQQLLPPLPLTSWLC